MSKTCIVFNVSLVTIKGSAKWLHLSDLKAVCIFYTLYANHSDCYNTADVGKLTFEGCNQAS